MMTKHDFIALADAIKGLEPGSPAEFHPDQIKYLADYCATRNPAFNRDRWLGYIAGTNDTRGKRTQSVKVPAWRVSAGSASEVYYCATADEAREEFVADHPAIKGRAAMLRIVDVTNE